MLKVSKVRNQLKKANMIIMYTVNQSLAFVCVAQTTLARVRVDTTSKIIVVAFCVAKYTAC